MGNAKTLTAFYDLRCAPYHFDFIYVAVMADAIRLDRDCAGFELVIVPDQGSALNCTDHRHLDQFSNDQANWRIFNIFMPTVALLPKCIGLTVCTSRQQAQTILDNASSPIFPDDYNIETPPEHYWTNDEFSMLANMGIEIPGLRAPQQALDYVDRWIENHVGKRKVVSITLRESSYGLPRNSNLPIWVEFAKRLDPEIYFPVFLPDIDRAFENAREDLAGFTTFNEAVTNLILRCAFYERCYIAMMATQGPSTICFLDGAIRCIIVKFTPPDLYDIYPPFSLAVGLEMDEPWPHATIYQRRMEESESLSLLETEFRRMVGLIENDPENALSRQKMYRIDAGPENIARISRFYGLLPFMPRAVIICQKYLDRNPGDLNVLKTMARADLILQHQNPKILTRSRDLYLQALKQHSNEDLLQFALAKVETVLGDGGKLDWLIERADLIEKFVNGDDHAEREAADEFDFLLSLASLFVRMDKVTEAVHVSQAAVRIKPTKGRITNLAVILEAIGNMEEARDLLVKLVDQGETTALICETLGRIYKSLGEPGLAVDFIQRGIELSALESKPAT